MGIPDFISELRRSIGTAPLWLMGATAVVLEGDRVLLIRRSDTGEWAPITGILSAVGFGWLMIQRMKIEDRALGRSER